MPVGNGLQMHTCAPVRSEPQPVHSTGAHRQRSVTVDDTTSACGEAPRIHLQALSLAMCSTAGVRGTEKERSAFMPLG